MSHTLAALTDAAFAAELAAKGLSQVTRFLFCAIAHRTVVKFPWFNELTAKQSSVSTIQH